MIKFPNRNTGAPDTVHFRILKRIEIMFLPGYQHFGEVLRSNPKKVKRFCSKENMQWHRVRRKLFRYIALVVAALCVSRREVTYTGTPTIIIPAAILQISSKLRWRSRVQNRPNLRPNLLQRGSAGNRIFSC